MVETGESRQNRSEEAGDLIRNRRHAIVAVISTAIVAASALRTMVTPVPLDGPWLIEPPRQLPQLRPLFIGLSIFFCGFVFWILFWFYKAARDKYERFLVAGFAIGFLLSTIERFVTPVAAANLQFVSTAATLVSLAAALTLFFKLPSKSKIPQPK